MNRLLAIVLLLLFTFGALPTRRAQAAAPKPTPPPTVAVPSDSEIGNSYAKPTVEYPEPRGVALRYTDIAVLIATLAAGAWALLKLRSRWAVSIVSIFALVYFGFYRAGCVCPIGAIQNVVLSVVNPAYTISIVVTALFVLPILGSLFFGRVFCGTVCPLGAIQDLMVRKPVRVPRLLDRILRWGRWLYLGAAVYFVIGGMTVLGRDLTVGADFIICRYDPFVNLFRVVDFRQVLAHNWGHVFQLAGPWWLWIATGLLLGGGVFIGRPYCRWLCPYGAILGACSRLSWKKVTVMPDKCIDCELCSDACEFGAIENHAAAKSPCLSCARCYEACPMERQRRSLPIPSDPLPDFMLPPPAERPRPFERAPVRGRRIAPVVEAVDLGYLDGLLAGHGNSGDAALPILQSIQARHRYFRTALVAVAERTGIPMARLIGLATFYNQFRLAPIGDHLVKVCTGTACHVAGAKRISDAVRLYLGLTGEDDTDAARRFTVQEVACVGCCSLAPVMQIDETTFGHLTADTAPRTLESYTPASHKRHVEPPPSHDSVTDDKQHHKDEPPGQSGPLAVGVADDKSGGEA